MIDIYALVAPNGQLDFLEGITDRMPAFTDPHHGAISAFTIQQAARGNNGLQGYISQASYIDSVRYPPNRIGRHLVEDLGGSGKYIFGNLAICGTRTRHGKPGFTPCGLTEEQRQTIQYVHTDLISWGCF
ncbi:hypothetical protein [Streptomyces sp. 1222.5]|uniref:hypothetical protein n=1 Tax=Streptomyces sp. 1222.5 TaxID=1881026 RepID=UPI003D734C05